MLTGARDAVRRGELRADAPWLLALVERRFEQLRPIDDDDLRFTLEQQWAIRAATDEALWPLLAEPAVLSHLDAWGNWNAVDDDGQRDLAYALWALPDALHKATVGVQLGRQLREIVRRHAVNDGGYDWTVSEADELARERKAQLYLVDEPAYRSQRDVHRRRRYLAVRDGTPWPNGKGRRPGARNRKRVERLNDLEACYLALPSETEPWELLLEYGTDRELVAEHAKRWKLTLHEARADWRLVQRELVDTCRCGYLTPLVQAELSGDAVRVHHERKRLARLRKRVSVQSP